MRIIKLQLHKEGYTWDAVPQEARDFYWEEFQVRFGLSYIIIQCLRLIKIPRFIEILFFIFAEAFHMGQGNYGYAKSGLGEVIR